MLRSCKNTTLGSALKRLTAILLLLLLLFNLSGYRLLFHYAQQQSDAHLVTRLDKAAYNEADLITITVPLNLPYQIDRPEFERVDGEINLDGKIYKYVKRKVEAGHLVLLCLPDVAKQQLQDAKHDYFKGVNDLDNTASSGKNNTSKSVLLKGLFSEYINEALFSLSQPSTESFQYGLPSGVYLLSQLYLQSPEQPPEVLA